MREKAVNDILPSNPDMTGEQACLAMLRRRSKHRSFLPDVRRSKNARACLCLACGSDRGLHSRVADILILQDCEDTRGLLRNQKVAAPAIRTA